MIDSFGAGVDPKMPFLPAALDPSEAWRRLKDLPVVRGGEATGLRGIRMVRHKPGRRCLIEYDLEVPDAPSGIVTLLGKARARGLDEAGPRLLTALRAAGFGDGSEDGISVPEPVGTSPEFRMWLQRKVAGEPATRLLAEAGGDALARRIAEAAHKLHRAGVRTARRHTMEDELRILHERLPLVAREKPHLAGRLERLLSACRRLGGSVPRPEPCGIHRDFYGDQVIVDGSRLYLIDLDLYCEGDPGLDVGNFVGHLTEQALRTLGDPDALADRERALEDRFAELSGEEVRSAARAYATLTLARHVQLSTLFPDRRRTTESLLELCEQRLRPAAGTPAFQRAGR